MRKCKLKANAPSCLSDPRLYYICGESLVLLSLVSTIVLNLALSNLTIRNGDDKVMF